MLPSFKDVKSPCPTRAPPVFLLDRKNKKGTIRQDEERSTTLSGTARRLEVICGNCDNSRVFNHRFLMSQFGGRANSGGAEIRVPRAVPGATGCGSSPTASASRSRSSPMFVSPFDKAVRFLSPIRHAQCVLE